MPNITKIVVTGGVCGGKTTALASIRSAFDRLGYKVITIPEPATEFKGNGVLPWECASDEEYQWCQMSVQLTRERAYERAARGMAADKILIVCDRGMLDNKYYMSPDEFQRVITDLGCTEVELRDSYDAVFHLVTAAKGAEEFYGNENNATRHETLEEAAAMDDGFIAAWTGHPHLRVIDNSTDFHGKMDRLVNEISLFLGEVAPFQTERKFLIDYPDEQALASLPNAERVDMTLTYLRSDEDHELRIRKCSGKGNSYHLTVKRVDAEGNKRLVRRQHLSKREYRNLLLQSDPDKHPIEKTRWCLMYANQYFDVDIFPAWKDKAILKLELLTEGDDIEFPPMLHVIREVTGEEAYTNNVMASVPLD